MEKIDITSKVVGKLCGENVELFLDTTKIGEVTFTNNQKEYVLLKGYFSEDHRIYQINKKLEPVKQYVEGCELGWC